MKLNAFGKFIWFIVAYIPMFIAVIVKYYLKGYTNILRLEISLFALLILVILLYILINTIEYTKDINERPKRFKVMKSSNSEYLLFVVTYLIPFYSIDFTTPNLISTAVMLLFIYILYIKSPLFAVNPILNLLGYNLYNIELCNEKHEVILITTKTLRYDYYNLELIDLCDGVYITNLLGDDKYE